MEPSKETEIFARCACHAEAILANYDAEYKQFEIALWGYTSLRKDRGLWSRLRWCWHILRHGTLWSDQVIFCKEDAIKFADWIKRME